MGFVIMPAIPAFSQEIHGCHVPNQLEFAIEASFRREYSLSILQENRIPQRPPRQEQFAGSIRKNERSGDEST